MKHEKLTFFYRIKAIIARNERLTKYSPRFCTLYQPINNEILGHKGCIDSENIENTKITKTLGKYIQLNFLEFLDKNNSSFGCSEEAS